MEKNTKVHVRPDLKEETVIRHGDALPLREPKKIEISGTIVAPVEFAAKRKHLYNKEDIHVLYNVEKKTILLVVDEKNYYRTEVQGSLSENPTIGKIGINKTSTYNLKSLVQLLRFNSHIFKHESDHKRIVDALMKFTAKVTQEVKKENDLRGNISDGFDQKVLVNANMTFTASMEIFKGHGKKDFLVEIMFEVRSAAIEFWFESVELNELIETCREELILDQIKLLSEFVCIQQ